MRISTGLYGIRGREEKIVAQKGGMKFQMIPCEKCGAPRILASACPDCGRKPRLSEVNSDVVRRNASLRKVNQLLEKVRDTGSQATGSVPSPEDMTAAVTEFTESVTEFAVSSGSDRAVNRMAAVVTSIGEMRSKCERAPALRPDLSRSRAVMATLDRLIQLWPAFEATLGAPTILEAQRLNRIGQEILDTAGTELVEYAALADAARAFEDLTIPNLFQRAISALTLIHPDVSLLELGASGSNRASALLGIRVDVAHGAQFVVLDLLADVHLDPLRFERVLKESARFCFANPLLSSTAQSAGSLDGLAASTRLLTESIAAFEAILQRETNDAALLRRILKFHAEIYEDLAGPLFAWYLMLGGLKSRPYKKLIESGTNSLGKSLGNSVQLDAWFLGRDAFLRNAANHGAGYSIAGDTVTFQLDSFRETRSVAVIIDMVFANLESLAATSWALTNALAQASIDIPMTSDDAEYIGISGIQIARVWLSQRGTHVLRDSATKESWEIDVSRGESSAFELAIALSLPASTEVRFVTVRVVGGATSVELPLHAYLTYAAALNSGVAGKDLMIALLNLRLASRSNNNTILAHADLEFAIGVLGTSLLNSDLSVIGAIRHVGKIAQPLGNDHIVQLVTRIFRVFRSQDAGEMQTLYAQLLTLVQDGTAPTMPTADRVTVVRF